ncbi:hypothetical protein GCM10010309_37620 [Streptomyces violaceochromogenes]|nr:hypothetical protein GCM10010309_37620 [Streptomyces violaceochromogenes]
MGGRQPGFQAGGMTHSARHKEREDILGSPADGGGRDAVPGRGEFGGVLGLTSAAGAVVPFVLRPDVPEALVPVATSTAGLVP